MSEPQGRDGGPADVEADVETVRMAVDEMGRAHLVIEGRPDGIERIHAMLRQEAAKLAALGDASPLEVRMARALAVVADRQTALDLSAGSQVTWSATRADTR